MFYCSNIIILLILLIILLYNIVLASLSKLSDKTGNEEKLLHQQISISHRRRLGLSAMAINYRVIELAEFTTHTLN